MPDAAPLLADQLAATPRAPIEPDDLAALPELGLAHLMGLIGPI
jgi:hypothetical protein